jgi:hypothetical protein
MNIMCVNARSTFTHARAEQVTCQHFNFLPLTLSLSRWLCLLETTTKDDYDKSYYDVYSHTHPSIHPAMLLSLREENEILYYIAVQTCDGAEKVVQKCFLFAWCVAQISTKRKNGRKTAATAAEEGITALFRSNSVCY